MREKLKGVYFIVIILLLWQVGSNFGVINRFIIPAPIEIARAFFALLLAGPLFLDIASSIIRVFVGFLLAILIGIPLGLFLGWNKEVAKYFLPVIEILRPIPAIAWIPMAIFWFGIGNGGSYFITAIASFFPIFLNTFAGAHNVEKVHINAALSLGASRKMIIKNILLPSALPFIITGARVGLGVSWICVIAAELIAARSGLGYMIQLHRMLLQMDKVIVGMIMIGMVGYLMNSTILFCEKRLVLWKKD